MNEERFKYLYDHGIEDEEELENYLFSHEDKIEFMNLFIKYHSVIYINQILLEKIIKDSYVPEYYKKLRFGLEYVIENYIHKDVNAICKIDFEDKDDHAYRKLLFYIESHNDNKYTILHLISSATKKVEIIYDGTITKYASRLERMKKKYYQLKMPNNPDYKRLYDIFYKQWHCLTGKGFPPAVW